MATNYYTPQTSASYYPTSDRATRRSQFTQQIPPSSNNTVKLEASRSRSGSRTRRGPKGLDASYSITDKSNQTYIVQQNASRWIDNNNLALKVGQAKPDLKKLIIYYFHLNRNVLPITVFLPTKDILDDPNTAIDFRATSFSEFLKKLNTDIGFAKETNCLAAGVVDFSDLVTFCSRMVQVWFNHPDFEYCVDKLVGIEHSADCEACKLAAHTVKCFQVSSDANGITRRSYSDYISLKYFNVINVHSGPNPRKQEQAVQVPQEPVSRRSHRSRHNPDRTHEDLEKVVAELNDLDLAATIPLGQIPPRQVSPYGTLNAVPMSASPVQTTTSQHQMSQIDFRQYQLFLQFQQMQAQMIGQSSNSQQPLTHVPQQTNLHWSAYPNGDVTPSGNQYRGSHGNKLRSNKHNKGGDRQQGGRGGPPPQTANHPEGNASAPFPKDVGNIYASRLAHQQGHQN